MAIDFTYPVDTKTLTEAPFHEVLSALTSYCEHAANSADINFDRLMSNAIRLAHRPEQWDYIIIKWLASNPTSSRQDVACAVLYGLWLKIRSPLSTHTLEALIHARPPSPRTVDAEYSYALAITRILDDPWTNPDARNLALNELRELLARGTGNPHSDTQVRGFIAKHEKRPQ